MKAVNSLFAKPGDSKRAKFNELVAWLAEFTRSRVITSGDANVQLITNSAGTSVIANASATAWDWPWQVSLSTGNQVTIGPGTVDGLELLREDPLLITEGPNAQLRSWICIQVTLDADNQINPDNPEALAFVHINDRARILAAKKEGLHPIAMIIWQDSKTAQRVHQIAYHNVNHTYWPKTQARPALHTFAAV